MQASLQVGKWARGMFASGMFAGGMSACGMFAGLQVGKCAGMGVMRRFSSLLACE